MCTVQQQHRVREDILPFSVPYIENNQQTKLKIISGALLFLPPERESYHKLLNRQSARKME